MLHAEQGFFMQLLSMAMLAIACIIHWARADATSAVLRANWALRPVGALETVRAIFYGTCVAFLGVTGAYYSSAIAID